MKLFKKPDYPKHLLDDELSFGKQVLIFGWEIFKVVVISLAIIIPIRYYLIKPFYVKGASMEPSFQTARDNYTSVLSQLGRYDEVVAVWKTYLEKNPTDVQAYYTLAGFYYRLNRAKDAISTLQTLASTVPSAKAEAEQFIVQIQNGTLKLQ